MGVLPCSEVRYIGESDCPQQGSRTSLIFDEDSNCIDNGEVLVTDVKVDDLVLNTVGSRFEQDGVQLIADESPTSEGHYNRDSYFSFEIDGLKVSCNTDDSQDRCTVDSLVTESSQLPVDTSRSVLPINNSDGDPVPLELTWLEQDVAMAVWVKWRGKWQAGIRCARADWPLTILKVKPTQDRKQYIVIYFPCTSSYSWADVLLVRHINELPEPIPYKTHEVGVKMVKDLTLAHRFIIHKIAVGMINLIGQLHSEALIEAARNVMVWKEFAVEASRCIDYSDIGRMLLKLQNVIKQCCLSSNWLQHSLQSWVQKCQNTDSAESTEMLKEELVDAILWNEVHSLSNAAVLTKLNSEWQTSKEEVMKSFSMSCRMSSGGGEQQSNDIPLAVELQISQKRPKLIVRRAEARTSQMETQSSHQIASAQIDSGNFDGRDIVNAASLEFNSSTVEVPHGAVNSDSPYSEAERWGEIEVEAGNCEIVQTKDVDVTPVNGVIHKSLDPGSKNRQCTAFIESKRRQCVRLANDGDVYCCVHLASRFVRNSVKVEKATTDAWMCEGTTVLGTKCKHRSLTGLSFCKKHQPQDDARISLSSPENKLKRKRESIHRSEATNCKDIVLVAEVETPLQVDPISVMDGQVFNERSLIETPEQPIKEYTGNEMLHCIGLCSQDAGDPCLESPKRYSLYCEKHLPSCLKRARNGKSRIISKEVFMDLLGDCYSLEQKLHLHKACELFHRLFKSILSLRNPVPKEIQLQWAISEASKDISVGKVLMKLVFSEKERLKRLWGFTTDKDTQNCSSIEEPIPIPAANDSDHDNEEVVKCQICSHKFFDDQSLGAHWMNDHRKEAQWLFRGYACAICLDSFTNKKLLESHVQERHHSKFVEQCLLLQCMPCGSHFGNIDQLWLHVLSVHPSNFRLPSAAQQQNMTVGDSSSHILKPGKSAFADNLNSENQGGLRKFICKFCGLKFDLLPDLGRHHQAAHMGLNAVGSQLLKKGVQFYANKLKSRRPRFKRGLGSASYNTRRMAGASLKKRIQASSLVSNAELKLQSHVAEANSLGKLAESQCITVAKILSSELKETKPRPSNFEVLSFAQSACCKVNLQALLEEKYGILPERLYLKAAKLCSEHNILVNWHQEGFNCPNGCKPFTVKPPVASLLSRSDAARPISALPPDALTDDWAKDEYHCVIDSRHFSQEPIQRTIILCDDISFGQESVPIACVVDENLLGYLPILVDGSDGQTTAYSMPWEGYTYVRKPLLDQSLHIETKLGCACTNSTCSSEICDHVYLFDNDYEDAKDIYGKSMKGRFPYDEKGRIILEEGYLVYECNRMCRCNRTCQNRVLQNGLQVKLEVFKTEEKGWAVRAVEPILSGAFVCEYIGEIINEHEVTKRCNRYGREGCNYIYEIDADSNDMKRLIEGQVPYVIDATNYGNVSRYINHSCSPNLMKFQVLVESMDCQLAHIGLYANQDIAVGEELTYDYRYKLSPGEGCPCLCGELNCRGRLY